MKNWGLTAMYIVVMLLGFFELYRTFRFYKWDKKAKQLLHQKMMVKIQFQELLVI